MSKKSRSDVLSSLFEKYKNEIQESASDDEVDVDDLPKTDESNSDLEDNIEPTDEETINEITSIKQKAIIEDARDRDSSNSPKKHALDQKLKELSGKQNLKARRDLIDVLKRLFTIQLVFMNIVVLLISIWSVFDIPFLREIDPHIYDSLCSFVKYYVSAVLVEMLGAIIFIVQKVFSDKNYD